MTSEGRIDANGNLVFGDKVISVRPIQGAEKAAPQIFKVDDVTMVQFDDSRALVEYAVYEKKGVFYIKVRITNKRERMLFGELIGIDRPEKYLAFPNRNGQILPDPAERLPDMEMNMSYPGTLSMPWIDVDGLCFFLEDEQRTSVDFLMGKRDGKPFLSIGKRLYREPGATTEILFSITPHKDAGDLVPVLRRNYAKLDKAFIHTRELPEWVYDRDGMVQAPIKNAEGELIASYEDVPDLAAIYQDFIGRDIVVHLFGWNGGKPSFHTHYPEGAHDDNYPYYRPNDTLGGRETLVNALKTLKEKGVRTSLYTNGRIANRELLQVPLSDMDVDVDGTLESSIILDHDHQPVFEKYNKREFALMCPASKPWQQMVAANLEYIAKLGADLVELDQIGFQEPEPCFNPAHAHTHDDWGRNYDELLSNTHECLAKEKVRVEPWIEGVVDCYQDVVAAYQPSNLFLEQAPRFWEGRHEKYPGIKEFNWGLIGYEAGDEIHPFVNTLFPHLLCLQGPISVPDYGWGKEEDFDAFLKGLAVRLGKCCAVPGIFDYGGGPFQILYGLANVKKSSEESVARQIVRFYTEHKDDAGLVRLRRLLRGVTERRKPHLDVFVRPDEYEPVVWEPSHKVVRFSRGNAMLTVAVNHEDAERTVEVDGKKVKLAGISDDALGWLVIA